MTRSFDLVDYKVAEADFFLERLKAAEADFFAAGCYFSAFVSAARSVTYAIQSVLADSSGFGEWYALHQGKLKDDEIARFFHDARRLGQHIGVSPVRGGSGGPNRPWLYHFAPCHDFPVVPADDVVSACRYYLTMLVGIVLACYIDFGEIIDPEQYYTEGAFRKRGLTIEDAEEELFGVRGWTDVPTLPIEIRWQLIRDHMAGCEIDHLFEKYLKGSRPVPERVRRPINLPEGRMHNDGWVLPPGHEDIDSYLDSLGDSATGCPG
jgi:hypothetical protein